MRAFFRDIALGAAALAFVPGAALAQTKDFKIGVIFDETGPVRGRWIQGGPIGNKIAIDMINEKGGVEGYKIVATYADAQSKVDVAINEAERLLNEAKVDMLMGVYSSAQCVPLAAKVDAAQKFWWATVCVSSAVFKDKNLKYVFRPTIHSDQYGQASCIFLAENAKEKLGKEPKDVKVAIINEDGPYGSASLRRRRRNARSWAFRLCTARDTRRPLPISRRSSPSCAAPAGRRSARRLQPRHHALPASGQGGRV